MKILSRLWRPTLALTSALVAAVPGAAAAQTVPHTRYAPNGPAHPTSGPLTDQAGGVINTALTCANGASSAARGLNPFPRVSTTIDAACPVATSLSNIGNVVLDEQHLDSRVRDLRISSVALNGIAWARVILPKGYYDAANSGTTYPVLYLLTGHGAGYQSWTCNTLVQNYLQDTNVIVVMPDGSRKYDPCKASDAVGDAAIPGWYGNWWQRSLDNNPERWETFILGEVKAIIEADFRTSGKNAIAGLSMGGYGAMYFATRTDSAGNKLFKSVASYSGLLNTVSSSGFASINGSLIAAGQSTDAVWGYYPGTPGAAVFGTQWYAHNPTSLMSRFVPAPNSLSTVPMFVSVGDGYQGRIETSYDASLGALELGARYTNEDFITTMVTANGGTGRPSNVTYLPYPGTHSWRNWDAALCLSLPTLLNPILAPGTSFVQPASLPCSYL